MMGELLVGQLILGVIRIQEIFGLKGHIMEKR